MEKITDSDSQHSQPPNAYYHFITRTNNEDGSTTAHYQSTIHAQGAWNEDEQHIGPVTGAICSEIELYQPHKHMRVGRLSVDILSVIPFGDIYINTKTIRSGKTIELIESQVMLNQRVYVIARAWRMLISDTTQIHGLEDSFVEHPEKFPIWEGLRHWKGGFLHSIEARASSECRAGKGLVWINTSVDMIHNEENSDFVHLMGLVDVANGTVPRLSQSEAEWVFPNIDLQIHMHRLPEGRWLGLETVQQIGTDGIGLTSSILHDVHGVFGRSEQILTVRKL